MYKKVLFASIATISLTTAAVAYAYNGEESSSEKQALSIAKNVYNQKIGHSDTEVQIITQDKDCSKHIKDANDLIRSSKPLGITGVREYADGRKMCILIKEKEVNVIIYKNKKILANKNYKD